MVEHCIENAGVTSSSLVLATTYRRSPLRDVGAGEVRIGPESMRDHHLVPMTNSPTTIRRKDPSKVELVWPDGHETTYTAAQLRRLCPCARCIHELTGQPLLDPKSVPDDLQQNGVVLVGNYAISVRFADGHDTGIYPWPLLRDRDPNPAPDA